MLLVALAGLALADGASAARLLVVPGRAVFAGPGGSKAVVLQAESAARVEVTSGGKTSVFVADADGVWAITSVGGVGWQERRWQEADAWLLAVLVALDPKASGVRSERGVVKGYQPPAGARTPLGAVEYRSDSRGVVSYTVAGTVVRRSEVGPLPQLAADAFAVPKKQKGGLARLADATAGLAASDAPKVSSTAGARGVTEEEKKLGKGYDFAAVEKVEKIAVSPADVDAFIRAGKLGGGS